MGAGALAPVKFQGPAEVHAQAAQVISPLQNESMLLIWPEVLSLNSGMNW